MIYGNNCRSKIFPIHKIRLEGFGWASPANTPAQPLPAIELESTPYGHIKVKIDDKETWCSIPDVFLKAVATLAPHPKL
jgi:hypothetical protein